MERKEPETLIVICGDIEPDRSYYHSKKNGNDPWQWFDGIGLMPELRESIKGFTDPFGGDARVSWFLRSDEQMGTIYDDYAWIAQEFKDTWKDFEARGDEIGWHPHLWRGSKEGEWEPSLGDEKWVEMTLKRGYEAIRKHFDVRTTQMGWNFQSNVTLGVLSGLGIKCDISAMPGIVNNLIDWRGTVREPYFPSTKDYRMPGEGTDRLDILEMPVTTYMLQSSIRSVKYLWNYFRAPPGRKRGEYAGEKYRQLTYFGITKHPQYLKPYLRALDRGHTPGRAGPRLIASVFHADECIPKSGIFSMKNVRRNLEMLTGFLKSKGMPFRFVTPHGVAADGF